MGIQPGPILRIFNNTHTTSAGARADNGGLGAEPPAGSSPGAEPLVRGRSPPEAEKLFSLERPKDVLLFSALFVLSRGLWTVIVDRGVRFKPFRVSTLLLLASLQVSFPVYLLPNDNNVCRHCFRGGPLALAMFNTATQLRFTTTCICTSSHLVTDASALALFCAVFFIIIISRTAAIVLAGDVRPPRVDAFG